MKGTLTDFFEYLVSLSDAELSREMAALGWKKQKFFKKNFSHVTVDVNGEIQGLALDGKIGKFALVA